MTGSMTIVLNRSGDGFNTGAGGSYVEWKNILFTESESMRGHTGTGVYNPSSATYHAGFTIYMGAGGFDNYKYALYGLKG